MAEQNWLEVSFEVDGEMAEALAGMLSDYFSNGVVIETNVTFNETEESYIPSGGVRVFGYMPFDDQLEEKRQRMLEALWYIGRIRELPEPVFRKIEDENWMESWKRHYHPIRLGERLLILPAWIPETDPGRITIRIDPSMAFGTGTHPSTQLCLVLLERYLEPGMTAIDLGCGSGILSIAAAKLGAPVVLAVDIDAEAVRASRENGEANRVLEKIDIHQASLGEIKDGRFTIKSAPMVVANILTPVILKLFAEGLSEILEPGGMLLLAGILEHQAASIQEAAIEKHLVQVDLLKINDWVALAFRKDNTG